MAKFKGSGIQVGDPSLLKTVELPPVGIMTPIQAGSGRSGIFQMNYTMEKQVADNLKNLILTNYGERLGNYGYGANLRPLTLEFSSQEDFESQAMTQISNAVRAEMPYVELQTFSTDAFLAEPGSTAGIGSGLTQVTMQLKYSVPQMRISERGLVVTLTCI